MNTTSWIIIGIIVVLLGVIALLIFRQGKRSGGSLDDRLAEFSERGNVASLEEIELSQPFSERVVIPLLRRLGIGKEQSRTKSPDPVEKNLSTSKKGINISVAYPKLLSKRLETTFLLHFFLAKEYAKVRSNIKAEFKDQEIDEHLSTSTLKIGDTVQVKLFHPDFDFSDIVTKKIDGQLSKITFLGKPKDNCEPGLRKILVSISNAETEQEIDSFTLTVRVVDFAFDHISLPLLSRVSTVVLGVGSFAMFILTFLEQIDTTVGLTSGTAAGALAAVVYANFYNLYQRIRPKTP